MAVLPSSVVVSCGAAIRRYWEVVHTDLEFSPMYGALVNDLKSQQESTSSNCLISSTQWSK